jgi:hypothetical protein
MSSSSDLGIDQSDIDKLNDKDKAELRQFFNNEQQRAHIQSRMLLLSFDSFPTAAAFTIVESANTVSHYPPRRDCDPPAPIPNLPALPELPQSPPRTVHKIGPVQPNPKKTTEQNMLTRRKNNRNSRTRLNLLEEVHHLQHDPLRRARQVRAGVPRQLRQPLHGLQYRHHEAPRQHAPAMKMLLPRWNTTIFGSQAEV